MRKKLVNIKSKIVDILSKCNFEYEDKTELDYAISCIDYMLVGEMPIDKETIESLKDSLSLCSVFSNNPQLMKLVRYLV